MLPVKGQAEAGMEGRKRGEPRADRGRAVIALLDRDELIALRLALGIPVITDETDGGVHRIRTAQREVDAIEIARRAFGQFCGEPNGGFRAQIEIAGGIGQLAQLPGGRLDDAFMAIPALTHQRPAKPSTS